jgi:hypothetical protein
MTDPDMSLHCQPNADALPRNSFGRLRPQPDNSVGDTTPPSRRHTAARALALRFLLAAVVLIPAAILTIRLGQPFAISAIASTTAIVLHAPLRYHQRPRRILACYAAGIAISAPISLVGAAVGLPTLLASTISAVIIVASLPGRVHPPTACIPLAMTAPAIQSVALTGRWLGFTGLAMACLAALWLLTAQPLAKRHRIVTCDAEASCATK